MSKQTVPNKNKTTAAKENIAGTAIQKRVHSFPIVGIGASAGGIEAVSELLEHIPSDLGMAYVIIQHLAPKHDSILPELLQKKTEMAVHKVVDGMALAANNVFVIPPDTYIGITDGHLTLSPGITPGRSHVIDHFLTALSALYQNNAIGVILSGTASDGTAGIQAIKTEGGITFAQDDTALFQGMPENAINSGFVDFILSPQNIAKELTALIKIPYIILPPERAIAGNEAELRKIHAILHNKRNVDFSNYKQTTINRRILRRMTLNRCRNLQEYIKYLRENEPEIDMLYNDLLINVTSFFREPLLYQSLTQKVFPSLLKDRKGTEPIRIWIPACSTGEEACTYAICLFDFLGERAVSMPIQIFATDLSEVAIEKARTGIYPKAALEHISRQRLEKYFTRLNGHYQIIKPIRDICVYATHNLLKDPPFSRMDIISCQNVLIYLESAPQKKILNAFHYALKPSGYLILGKSETVGSATDLFEQVDKEFKIYTKKGTVANLQFDFSVKASQAYNAAEVDDKKNVIKPETEIDIEKEIDRLLLKFVPASVVINKDMQIIRFHGGISKYLQPASGKASLHLLKMVRDELLFELRALIHKAEKDGKPVKKDGIQLPNAGLITEINLEVIPVKTLREAYFLIIFREILQKAEQEQATQKEYRGKDAKTQRIQILDQELLEGREQMKTMSEEFEATREELQSANEEVLSSNEELQSINEELETSKEELQSSNEELTTINEELQHRNRDLKESVNYTEAIVQTIREPLLVLSADMRVRTANKAFYSTFHLSVDEVEGQSIHDVGSGQFNIPELKRHLDQVISSNTIFQDVELVATFVATGEKVLMYSAMRMTQEESRNNRILLSIEDITNRKRSEETLKSNEERFRLLVQNAFDILAIFTKSGTIQFLSGSIENILGYKPEERIGLNIFDDPIIHPDDMELKRQMLRDSIAHPHLNIRSEFRLMHKNGNYKIMEAVCINLLDNPSVHGIVINYRDVTQRRIMEKQKEEFLAIASHELKTPVTSIKGYTEILIDNFENANDVPSVELVRKLDKQVNRLTYLIKDLLDVTKITEGQLKLKKDHFDINDLINDVIEQLKLTTNKHTFITHLSPLKKIWADKERIRQVLTNLISNAIKYSPNADKITISSASVKLQVKVSVRDYGIGMPKGTEKKVFERFFRVSDKNASTFPGLGLGLFIAAEIIKRHNGTIKVESEKNKGSDFSFTIPIGSKSESF